MDNRILFVDDDPNLLASFQRSFRKLFQFDTAAGGEEGLALLSKGSYAVIVADMRMPGMDGMELLEEVRKRSPNTIRLIFTGNADQQTAVDAVNRGQIFRFINKPCAADLLVPVIQEALDKYSVQEAERHLLENTLTGCVKVLSEILGMVSPESLGRGQRLRDSMRKFAEFLAVPFLWEIELGALLSPIGYASLPPILLRKVHAETDLTPAEAELVRQIPRIGYELIAGLPRMKDVAEIVLYQNKNYAGQGFPGDGRSGEALPVGARMLKILADRAALETDGVVKRKAYDVMRTRTGWYDGALLDQCFVCFPNFLANAISSELPVLTVTINQLQPGQVVVSDIHSRSGSTLLSGGSRLSEMILQRLRNHAALGDVQEPVMVQNSAPAGVKA